VLPDGLVVLAIALALVPGWLYLRLRERSRPPSNATGLSELLEVAAVGLITTGFSVLVVSLLPHSWTPGLVDLEAWAHKGNDYLREHVRSTLVAAALVLGLASAIAFLLHKLQQRATHDRFDAHSSVWGKALQPHDGKGRWISLQLRGGQLVEGLLHSASLGYESYDERDIALARPIRVTEDGRTVDKTDLDHVIVPGREIVHITVAHLPVSSTTPGDGDDSAGPGGGTRPRPRLRPLTARRR
jgi:Family of unknown function (DUF6338)